MFSKYQIVHALPLIHLAMRDDWLNRVGNPKSSVIPHLVLLIISLGEKSLNGKNDISVDEKYEKTRS